MPYIITDACTLDGACVDVCPVLCIHTGPNAPQFYIDPEICIECEQCKLVCPVDAIFPHDELPARWQHSIDVNASFFRAHKPPAGPVPFDTAWHMVQAVQAYATEHDLAVAVAIVDGEGVPIAAARMDGAAPHAAELALNKALTATYFQLATDPLRSEARQPWFRSLTVASRGGVMAGGGGIPIVDEAAIIGAIGIAGGKDAQEDIVCCRAGLAVLDQAAH